MIISIKVIKLLVIKIKNSSKGYSKNNYRSSNIINYNKQ